MWEDAPESITQEVFRGVEIDGVPGEDPHPPAYETKLLASAARLAEGAGVEQSDEARDA